MKINNAKPRASIKEIEEEDKFFSGDVLKNFFDALIGDGSGVPLCSKYAMLAAIHDMELTMESKSFEDLKFRDAEGRIVPKSSSNDEHLKKLVRVAFRAYATNKENTERNLRQWMVDTCKDLPEVE